VVQDGGREMDAETIVQKAKKVNPEMQLILDIAVRARELEEKSAPMELRASADIVAIPTKLQCPV